MNFSVEVEAELLQCRSQHSMWLDREESFWKQISRIKWLQEGKANTKFFHAFVKNKKKSQVTDHIILEYGSILHSGDEVHDGAVQFFRNLFTVPYVSMDTIDLDLL